MKHWSHRLWLALPSLLLLQGCGFEPVYGQHEADKFAGSLPTHALKIERGHNDELHKIALEDRLSPGSHEEPVSPDYQLKIVLAVVASPTVIEGNATVQRYSTQVDADFTLTRTADDKKVLVSHARRLGSYNASRQFFSDFEAAQDTSQRTIEELAADIEMRLRAFLIAPPKDYKLPPPDPEKKPKPNP